MGVSCSYMFLRPCRHLVATTQSLLLSCRKREDCIMEEIEETHEAHIPPI